MDKYRSSNANQAFANYFEDLIEPSTRSETPLPLPYQPTLTQTERLFARASCLENLLNDNISMPNIPNARQLRIKQTHVVSSATGNIQANICKDGFNALEAHSKSEQSNANVFMKNRLPNDFQVLLCNIAGVTIALPLLDLGGIYKMTKLVKIAKKPSWYIGVLVKGNDKFNCIDVGSRLLPMNYSQTMPNHGEYKYAVQVGKTPYALCCHAIFTTLPLYSDDIKWRQNTQIKPWLTGLLKEKMCALVDSAKMVQDMLTKIE